MRSSEKTEAKAAGAKSPQAQLNAASRTILTRQHRHRPLQPTAIDRVIRIGSKVRTGMDAMEGFFVFTICNGVLYEAKNGND
jgi:hypothetical protein